MRKPKTIENHPYVLVSLPIDIQSIHMVLDGSLSGKETSGRGGISDGC